MQISFDASGAENIKHTCQARRDGEWAIFTCPLCPGFERRMNLRTGAIKYTPGPNPVVLHRGQFVPVGMEQNLSLPN